MTSVRVLMFVLFCCTLFPNLVFIMPEIPAVLAQTQAETIREINTLLRKAERSFHIGKFEQARQELDQIETMLEAADAGGDTPQLKSARTKHERLVNSLERRMSPTGSSTAEPAKPAVRATPATPPQPAGKKAVAGEPAPARQAVKLSASDARKFRELNREMEKTRNRLTDSRWWELTSSTRDNRLKEAGMDSENYRRQLDDIVSGMDAALSETDEVRESRSMLADIQNLIRQRGRETEPAREVPPAVVEALALEKQILDIHLAYNQRFQGVYGNTMVHGTTLEEQFRVGRDGVNHLNALEREVVTVLQPILREVVEKYGDNSMDIDARKWAGDITGFDGPGKTNEISRAALEYIRKEPAWNPPGKGVEILAVAVRGPWDVGARDLLGRDIQWRIPVHVAITNKEMKRDNIVRVYELSLLTQEGRPDRVDKKPPFVEYWVGNSWNMRLKKVPSQK